MEGSSGMAILDEMKSLGGCLPGSCWMMQLVLYAVLPRDQIQNVRSASFCSTGCGSGAARGIGAVGSDWFGGPADAEAVPLEWHAPVTTAGAVD